MAGIVDLDALSVTWFRVKKVVNGEPKEFMLNDHITTGISIWAPATAPLLARIGELAEAGGAASEIRKLQAEFEERVLYLTTEIFRNVYPETTDEWMAATFSHDERWEIVQLFFMTRGAASESASSATAAQATELSAVTTVTTDAKIRHRPPATARDSSQTAATRKTRNLLEEALEG